MTSSRDHIFKCHPPITCYHCKHLFETEYSRQIHESKRCTWKPSPGGTSWAEKLEVLRGMTLLSSSSGRDWEQMYTTLFPDEVEIPSPCEAPLKKEIN
jgi:hypothetical protein